MGGLQRHSKVRFRRQQPSPWLGLQAGVWSHNLQNRLIRQSLRAPKRAHVCKHTCAKHGPWPRIHLPSSSRKSDTSETPSLNARPLHRTVCTITITITVDCSVQWPAEQPRSREALLERSSDHRSLDSSDLFGGTPSTLVDAAELDSSS